MSAVSPMVPAEPGTDAARASRSEYVPALDGLRFLAFFAVFLNHAIGDARLGFDAASMAGRVLGVIQQHGWMGVDLFLCLSAYLLTRLMLVERERNGSIDIPSFYIRRLLRIWPLYFATLIVGFGLVPLVAKLTNRNWYAGSDLWREHLVPFLLFLGNWSTAVFGYAESPFLDLLWTISLEEQFYLILPLAVAVILRRRTLAIVAGTALVFSILVRVWMVQNDLPARAVYMLPASHFDAFAVGIFIAVFADEARAWAAGTNRKLIITVGFVAFLTAAVALGNIDEQGMHLVPLLFLVSGAAGCALMLALTPGWFSRLLSGRALVYLGKISYGLYVLHVGVISFTSVVAGRLHLHPALTAAIQLVTVIAVASLSYQVLERPFLLLKERYTKVRSRPV